MAYLGHSLARATVLRAAGVSAPYATPARSELCAWGNGLGHTLCSRIRSSTVMPEASRNRFRKPLAPEGKAAVLHVTFTVFGVCA